MGQKQGIEAATALLYALETRIQTAPHTFAPILKILGAFALSPELVAQMKEQCETREVTATQSPPAQSVLHQASQATATHGPPMPPVHPETGGTTFTHGTTQRMTLRPPAPSINPGL